MRLAITLVILALAGTNALADHGRPGLFSDVGEPPAEEDVSHGNALTKLMVERCTMFVKNMKADADGHILDYMHNYQTGFCIGWVNASMVFLNMRDAAGAPALNVCLPEGIHTLELVQSFLEFAKEHPDDLKYNPSFLIYWAMLDKYQCQK